jgi:hypothetical protein
LCGTHPATIWRWALKGAAQPDGTRDYPDAWKLPGRWMTTKAAILEFIQRQTDARRGRSAPTLPRTPARRQREIARADAKLAAMGV